MSFSVGREAIGVLTPHQSGVKAAQITCRGCFALPALCWPSSMTVTFVGLRHKGLLWYQRTRLVCKLYSVWGGLCSLPCGVSHWSDRKENWGTAPPMGAGVLAPNWAEPLASVLGAIPPAPLRKDCGVLHRMHQHIRCIQKCLLSVHISLF